MNDALFLHRSHFPFRFSSADDGLATLIVIQKTLAIETGNGALQQGRQMREDDRGL
jgi:hypothetical protein